MSTENTFSRASRNGSPLQAFLRSRHEVYAADPARLLKPLIGFLADLHATGQSHGAILPSSMMVDDSGAVDLAFLKAKLGFPEKMERPAYYPHGASAGLGEAKRHDIEALAGVFHLIICDQPPPSPERRKSGLKDKVEAADWPPAFIALLDQMLDPREQNPPTLADLSASLDATPAQGATPEEPPPAESPADDSVAEAAPAAPSPEPEPAPEPQAPQDPAAATVPEEPPVPAPLSVSLTPIVLPNAMVGRGFSVEIPPLLGTDWPAIGDISVVSGMPPGLEIRDGACLAGIPSAAGDYRIVLGIRLQEPDARGPASLERPLSLIINPDPKSLWKDIPSDATGPYAKPDTDSAALDDGPLTVLGASLRGRSHAHVGGYRDDDFSLALHAGWHHLTVADGAGSSKYSRQGSKLACDAVKDHFARYFAAGDPPLERLVAEWAAAPENSSAAYQVKTELYKQFGAAVVTARRAIEQEASAAGGVLRDFHTTLITSLLHQLPDGRWFIATFSIGDGAAAIIGAPGDGPCLLTKPDGGDFAGQTLFLTMKESTATGEAIMSRIRISLVPEFEALLLVTDGISDPRFDSETLLGDAATWRALWQEIRGTIPQGASRAESAQALIPWMGFHSPGHHDDRTLVLASPNLIPSAP